MEAVKAAETTEPAPGTVALVCSPTLTRQALSLASSVLEDFRRRLSTGLSAALNLEVTAEPEALTTHPFGEYMNRLETPRCTAVLRSSVPGGRMAVGIGPSLLFPVVESLLGGEPEEQAVPARPLTDLELGLLRIPVRMVAGAFSESWKRFLAIDYELEAVDGGESAERLIPAPELVTVVRVRLSLGERAAGILDVGVTREIWSQFGLHPAQEREESLEQAGERRKERMLGVLGPAEVELDVSLEGCELTLGDLLSMQPGKILVLDGASERPMTGALNGSGVFAGRVVVRGGRRAFQLTQIGGGS